jgi:hypothetical protein
VCYLLLLRKSDQNHLAPASPTPALRQEREGRGIHCGGDSRKLRGLGHPPRIILTEEREKIQTLGSLVEDKVRYAPDSAVRTRKMNGDTRLFRELVNAGKLYSVLGRTAPLKVVEWLRAQLGRN